MRPRGVPWILCRRPHRPNPCQSFFMFAAHSGQRINFHDLQNHQNPQIPSPAMDQPPNSSAKVQPPTRRPPESAAMGQQFSQQIGEGPVPASPARAQPSTCRRRFSQQLVGESSASKSARVQPQSHRKGFSHQLVGEGPAAKSPGRGLPACRRRGPRRILLSRGHSS